MSHQAEEGYPAPDQGQPATGRRSAAREGCMSRDSYRVVGAGQYGTYCAPGGGDAWVQNYCTDGPTITNP